jgi:predicted nuclease of predicted toxin-antitoxin system
MRFLIDEQLPVLLAEVLVSKGYEAIHVSSLGSVEHVSDSMIIQRSLDEDYVVITKDVDFLNSFLIKNQPKKLVYVVTGNIKNRDLLNLFRQLCHKLVEQLTIYSVVEVNRTAMRILH